jgi:hypothetical protein
MSSTVDGILDQLPNELRGGAVPSGRSMSVDLKCDRRVGVANSITEDFGIDAGVERQRRVRMAYIVELDPPNAS